MTAPTDLFVLILAVVVACYEVVMLASGGATISARVRYWTVRYPWLIAVYCVGAMVLAYHFWG